MLCTERKDGRHSVGVIIYDTRADLTLDGSQLCKWKNNQSYYQIERSGSELDTGLFPTSGLTIYRKGGSLWSTAQRLQSFVEIGMISFDEKEKIWKMFLESTEL